VGEEGWDVGAWAGERGGGGCGDGAFFGVGCLEEEGDCGFGVGERGGVNV